MELCICLANGIADYNGSLSRKRIEYLGDMMDLCFTHRAVNLEHRYLDTSASARVILTCQLPLSEIVTDFFSLLKSRSSGYASFEYVYALFWLNALLLTLVAVTRMPDIKRAICQRYFVLYLKQMTVR